MMTRQAARSVQAGIGRWMLALLLGAVMLGPSVVAADEGESADAPAAVGERLEAITLEDQFGESRSVDAETRTVVFSRDMDGGAFLKTALEGVGEEALAERGVAYVADISGMPGLIARLFAVPAMRNRGYPMLLDRDGSATARLPDIEGQATVLRLDALTLTEVQHLDSAEKVRSALGLEPAASEE